MGRVHFTCSFDDGDVADLRLADLMCKYNIKGTFYIPQHCSLVSQSLSDEQIRVLSHSFEIGGHTLSHPVLTDISFEKSEVEISGCKKWLEGIIGKQIDSFCPPTGRFNNSHILLQKKAGFRLMRTVEMLDCTLEGKGDSENFVILPTTIQVYNHTYGSYIRNLVKRLRFENIPVLLKMFDKKWEQMSYNYFDYFDNHAERDHYFHLWGHSWEIEKYSLWDILEKFFEGLQNLPGLTFCTNSELSKILGSEK